ncbi:hypothetical protein QQ045_024274 [Rhodiola kirilowii]
MLGKFHFQFTTIIHPSVYNNFQCTLFMSICCSLYWKIIFSVYMGLILYARHQKRVRPMPQREWMLAPWCEANASTGVDVGTLAWRSLFEVHFCANFFATDE